MATLLLSLRLVSNHRPLTSFKTSTKINSALSSSLVSRHEEQPFRKHGISSLVSRPVSVTGLNSRKRVVVKSAGSDMSSTTLQTKVVNVLHLVVSLGIILAMDKFLKKAFVAAAIKFPSALFGMFCIFTVLMVLDSTVPVAATSLMNFFQPALLFIQRWLPLFYVPSLVVLPLAVKDIPAASGLKILFIIVGGWFASLAVAGYTAIAVRKMVNTEMTAAEPMAKPSPFSSIELWSWSGIFIASFVSALFYPTVLGTNALTCLPFLLAATVIGYMVGSGLPSDAKKILHPIISCALSADLAALAYGKLAQCGLDPVLDIQRKNALAEKKLSHASRVGRLVFNPSPLARHLHESTFVM